MPTFYCNYFFAWNSGAPYTRGPPGLCLPCLPHCYATVPLPSDTQWWSIANLHDPRVTRTSMQELYARQRLDGIRTWQQWLASGSDVLECWSTVNTVTYSLAPNIYGECVFGIWQFVAVDKFWWFLYFPRLECASIRGILRGDYYWTFDYFAEYFTTSRDGSVIYRVPTGQRKLEKVTEFEWLGKVRERSGENIFFWKIQGRIREDEKLVPPYVRFSGENASNTISAGAPPQAPLGELTALPQTL